MAISVSVSLSLVIYLSIYTRSIYNINTLRIKSILYTYITWCGRAGKENAVAHVQLGAARALREHLGGSRRRAVERERTARSASACPRSAERVAQRVERRNLQQNMQSSGYAWAARYTSSRSIRGHVCGGEHTGRALLRHFTDEKQSFSLRHTSHDTPQRGILLPITEHSSPHRGARRKRLESASPPNDGMPSAIASHENRFLWCSPWRGHRARHALALHSSPSAAAAPFDAETSTDLTVLALSSH